MNKYVIFCIVLLAGLFSQPAWAHTINYALENAPVKDVSWYYFTLGFKHIVPEGIDHVLFIIGICLINKTIKPIIWQASAFTVAHTIALALSMKNIIAAPPAIVEPIIAASIVFVAVENLVLQKMKPWRLALIFMFGLVHGMGFASSLNEIGLPRDTFFTSILSFNVGVEVCQVLIICLVYFLIIKPFHAQIWYRKAVVYPISLMIAVVSSYWVIERLSGI